MIPALILAAGSGRRMGGPKALLQFQGESLLHRTVRIVREAGCASVFAVVADWDPGPLEAALVPNPEALEGMASSLRRGIAALPPDTDRVLLLAVDMVAVDADLLRRLVALSDLDRSRPAACAYGDGFGIPAVLPQRLFPELLTLRGDRGAKAILRREAPATLPFPGGLQDLDTPEDLARFRR
jgi:CTP:molybdopterin cytidylyltransferase MocA